MEKGLLVVISGPSGAGKSITCNRVLELRPDIQLSVSCTTRAMRPGEKDGVNYFFLSEQAFVERIDNNMFLEHAQYLDRRYGTPKDFVFDKLDKGQDVILEIEVQGALMVKQAYPEAVLIFVVPPSMAVLADRLNLRGTETEDQTRQRLMIAESEIELVNRYDFVVVNEKIDVAAKQVIDIISAEKCAINRNKHISERLIKGETLI